VSNQITNPSWNLIFNKNLPFASLFFGIISQVIYWLEVLIVFCFFRCVAVVATSYTPYPISSHPLDPPGVWANEKARNVSGPDDEIPSIVAIGCLTPSFLWNHSSLFKPISFICLNIILTVKRNSFAIKCEILLRSNVKYHCDQLWNIFAIAIKCEICLRCISVARWPWPLPNNSKQAVKNIFAVEKSGVNRPWRWRAYFSSKQAVENL